MTKDQALKEAKNKPTIDNYRLYKQQRNYTNRIITNQRHNRKKEKFKSDLSAKQKWSLVKDETGQQSHPIPQQIKENNRTHTKPREMASAMNRQYLTLIRQTIQNIPQTEVNPLDIYSKALGNITTKLNINQINMSDLKSIMRSLSPTTSSSKDFISMKVVKAAGDTLLPHILLLVNTIISTEHYPMNLKLTKIVPVKKPDKDPQETASWRPINIVPALSKVVEKCLLAQVTKYLKENNLIHHTHHGSVGGKSTQTLIEELYDILLTSLENGDDAAFHSTRPVKSVQRHRS